MRSLRYAATVWVPVSRFVHVEKYIAAATERYGGVTRVPAHGEWHDGSGYIEKEAVVLHEWWSVAPLDVSDIIKGLLDAGEKEVMVSLVAPHLGRHVSIFTKEDYK